MSAPGKARVSLSWFAVLALAAICACGGSGGNANPDSGMPEGGVHHEGGKHDGGLDGGPPPPCPASSDGCFNLDPTVTTNLADSSKFLYSGTNPVQKGVDFAALNLPHVSVVRGQVYQRSSTGTNGLAPLPGVTVTVPGHPELGTTTTQKDGSFSMVVNGGGTVVVEYTHAGYLPVQRQARTTWLDYAITNDVVMTAPEPGKTVTLSASSKDFQVVRGMKHGGASSMTPDEDPDGARTATLLIPPGTTASIAGLNDKPTTFHATEFTTGSNGLKAMPADLPPTSVYTYALDLTIDEAKDAPVTFNQPVVFYVENFTGFPVGNGTSPTTVPSGYYDRGQGAWVPTPSGQIVRVLSNDGSTVTLDLNGSATPAADTDFTPPLYAGERAQVAALYSRGAELWRVALPHFSAYDLNWNADPPKDAEPPDLPDDGGDSGGGGGGGGPGDPGTPPTAPTDKPICRSGSIIECENQILAEEFPVAGTPYVLRYQSERNAGSKNITIAISGPNPLPSDLKRIDTVITTQGKTFTFSSMSQAPNQTVTWAWDRKDTYNRTVSGVVTVNVAIGYVYAATGSGSYSSTPKFGALGGGGLITGSRALSEVTLWERYQLPLNQLDARTTFGFGGLSFSPLNLYDPSGQMLYGGDGTRETVNGQSLDVIDSYLSGVGPTHIAMGSDGSLYVTDSDLVRRIDPKHKNAVIAGNSVSELGTTGDHGNGKPATKVAVTPYGVAVAPDGTVYVTTSYTNRLRKVDPKTGLIQTVAGNGSSKVEDCLPTAACGDGQVATTLALAQLGGVVVGPDGGVYFSEILANGHGRVRKLELDGTLSTAINNLAAPDGVAFGPDGSLYVVDSTTEAVVKQTPGGTVSTVAGGTRGNGGDGGPATKAGLFLPIGVVVDPTGGFYITDSNNGRLRYVDRSGIIRTITSPFTGITAALGDGGPVGSASLLLPLGVTMGSDGSVYVADSGNSEIRVIHPPLPGFSLDDAFIPSQDGSLVYHFDYQGRQLETLDATRGQKFGEFTYDKGLLSKLVDGNGNTTTIDRSTPGKVVVTAPFGQTTTLALDSQGYVSSITDPAGAATQLTFFSTGGTENGLLSTLTDAKGQVHNFTFDSNGLLQTDSNPAGGSTTLVRSNVPLGWQVALTSALGRTETVEVRTPSTGGQQQVVTNPSGTGSSILQDNSGNTTITLTDATGAVMLTSKQVLGPDPRWGMVAPIIKSSTITTPSKLTMSTVHTSSVSTSGGVFGLKSSTDKVTVNKKSSYTAEYATTKSGATVTATTAAGRTSTTTLDSMDRLVGMAAPGLPTLAVTYNTKTCPSGGEGCNARVTSITMTSANPKDGSRTWTPSYRYSPDTGFASALNDSLGHQTSLTRDPVGRITGASLPFLAGTTAAQNLLGFSYDTNGNVASVTVPSANSPAPVHNFSSYSPTDLLETYDPPQVSPPLSSRDTTYTYNADGQVTAIQTPEGSTTQTVAVGYDSFGRVGTITDPLSGVTDTYSYMSVDRVQSIVTSDGVTTTYGYDGVLPTSAAWSGPIAGTLGWTYDNFFRVATRTLGTKIVTYAYDADSLYTGTSTPATFTVAHDVGGRNGLLAGSTLGAVTDVWSYNGFAEPSAYSATFGGTTTLYSMSGVTRDAAGRITAMSEKLGGTSHVWAFGYDEHGDLIQATLDGTTHSYTFDTNGNRTSVDGALEGPYDAQDRLVASGSVYTANGGLQSKTAGIGGTYSYDLSGNLRSVALATSDTISYVVDGQNRRIGKTLTHAGTPIAQGFLYEGGRVVAELNEANSVVSVFVYGSKLNVPDYMVRAGKTYRVVSDWRGSVRTVVEAGAGTVVESIDYDAWGNVTSFTDTTCSGGPTCFYFQPFGFAGGVYDKDTELVRFGARDYDPSIGRWMQKDASRFDGGTDFYVYAFNDPINSLDPTGFNVVRLENPLGKVVRWLERLSLEQSTQAENNWSTGNYSGAAANGAASVALSFASVVVAISPELVNLAVLTAGCGNLARVIPGDVNYPTLGPPGTPDVFVTPAEDIAGLNASQIAERLAIPAATEYTVYEFPAPEQGVASPVNRANPGFVGGGKTAGGATEYVIPNGPIPPDAVRSVVK